MVLDVGSHWWWCKNAWRLHIVPVCHYKDPLHRRVMPMLSTYLMTPQLFPLASIWFLESKTVNESLSLSLAPAPPPPPLWQCIVVLFQFCCTILPEISSRGRQIVFFFLQQCWWYLRAFSRYVLLGKENTPKSGLQMSSETSHVEKNLWHILLFHFLLVKWMWLLGIASWQAKTDQRHTPFWSELV